MRLEAIEHMGPIARRSNMNAVHRFLMDIIKSDLVSAWARLKAAELLDNPGKSKQYAIAVRIVSECYTEGIRTMSAAEDFSYITDPEVIDFVLEKGVYHDEIGHRALRCM